MKEEFEDMKVCMYRLSQDQWGLDSEPTSNWAILHTKYQGTFEHGHACEFIIYTRRDADGYEGLTDEVVALIREAKDAGYAYICFYG